MLPNNHLLLIMYSPPQKVERNRNRLGYRRGVEMSREISATKNHQTATNIAINVDKNIHETEVQTENINCHHFENVKHDWISNQIS